MDDADPEPRPDDGDQPDAEEQSSPPADGDGVPAMTDREDRDDGWETL